MGGRGQYPRGTRQGELPTQMGKPSKQFDVTKPPFTDINGKQLINIKDIDGFEKLMQMSKIKNETGWYSDKKGNLLAGAAGNSESVGVAYPLEERKGKIFTHNHPRQIWRSF